MIHLEDIKLLNLSSETEQSIYNLYEQRELTDLNIGLFGSFSVGKSTLINTLLGQNILPTHAIETTAISTLIKVADKEEIMLKFEDGREQLSTHEEFLQLVAGKEIENIKSTVVNVAEPLWMKNINFIDTPGRNTKYARHIDASEAAISESHVAFYVTSWRGLDLEDVIYIKHILRYQPNLYFIVNKIDSIDQSQGLSIDDLKEHVEKDIKEMLGQEYPVLMASAKTRFNIDQLMDLIMDLKISINDVKDKKFKRSIREILTQEKEKVNNEIIIINNASKTDYNVEAERNQLNIKYEKSKSELKKYLDGMEDQVKISKEKINDKINNIYIELEDKLINIANQESKLENIQSSIENEIITARNKVTNILKNELISMFGDENSIQLSDIDKNSISINISELDFSDLERRYSERESHLQDKRIQLEQQLRAIENKDVNLAIQEKEAIIEKINGLEEELQTEYIPRFKEDINFDPQKYEKMLSKIGMVGDVVIAAALTAGTAAPAKATASASKGIGKEVIKTTIKTQSKKISAATAKEVASNIAKSPMSKEIAKEAFKKVAGNQNGVDNSAKETKEDKNNLAINAIKAVDRLTSPVETVAKKIGQSLDGNESPRVYEDMNYRSQFYAKKMEVEQKKNNELKRLKELENSVKNDEILKQKLEDKILKTQQNAERELSELKEKLERQKQVRFKEHQASEIRKEIKSILEDEQSNISYWFNYQMEQCYHVVQKMMPEALKEDVRRWETEINRIDELKIDNKDKLNKRAEELQSKIILLDEMIERY